MGYVQRCAARRVPSVICAKCDLLQWDCGAIIGDGLVGIVG